MTDRYVGLGGNDGNDGLSWANRKLTLNGVEDTPVVAGDTVYVGPGTYRETLTVDVSGSGGNPITYIGDVTGENTDGVGGIVRITGSDNDQTETRTKAIDASTKDYRTFRGFYADITGNFVYADDSDNWIIEDCFCGGLGRSLWINGTCANWTVRRCVFLGAVRFNATIWVTEATTIDNAGHLIENCLLVAGARSYTFVTERVGGGTIKNCTFFSGDKAIYIKIALSVGQQWDVNNCIFHYANVVFDATAVGEIVEDYNALYRLGTARTNTNTGGNSNTYPPLFEPAIMFDGYNFPWWFGKLSEWSQIAAIAGTGESSDDLLGITRPTTSAKKSWGAVQFNDNERETTTTYDGSDASIKFADAGRHQMFMPVANESTTISVRVYREANYAGTNPQLIIKQPGQSDDVTVDVAAASQWNELTTTLTPAANPPYVIIELVSNNTAVAGDFGVFFDLIEVS